MPPFPVGRSGGPGAALAGGDLKGHASQRASGQDVPPASTLGLVLQSPQRGEPGASALESLDSRGGFLISRSKDPPRLCRLGGGGALRAALAVPTGVQTRSSSEPPGARITDRRTRHPHLSLRGSSI